MKKSLLDIVFRSEKRKTVLLLLQDGPQETQYLLELLGTTRQALLPQMKMLEEYSLIDHYKDTYELTAIGKLIVNRMVPLLNSIGTFDSDIDYWGSREIDFIPHHLLKRINEIKDCETLSTHFTDMHTIQMQFHEASKISKSLIGVTAFYHPSFPKVFSELMQLNVNIYTIITNEVLERLRTHREPEFEKVLKSDLFHLFVYPEKIGFLSIGSNDYYMLLRLLRKDGEFDNKYISCSSPSAIKWGKELFGYYLKDSIPITEI